MNQNRNIEDIYCTYAESCPIDNAEIWEKYQALRASVAHLSQPEQVTILECAAALANVQEKAAFFAAFRMASQI